MHVEASTLKELFLVSLQGMNSVLYTQDHLADTSREHYLMKLSSLDKTTLLIDFLSDILTASYEHKMIYDRCKFITLAGNSVNADLSGFKASGFDEDIKAVTYHEANVHQNEQGNWETVVIFDI